ncbi:hypothetical protein SDC9_140123 [bioreactor metagenome]|uniref:Uncharacterized protein n=1 Tax=bioreactor metagenome TaxID=1076179 RepID=A0A645DUC9_9ZZZZ
MIARAAATPHRAATAVEHAQLDRRAGLRGVKFVKQRHQRNLGAIQLPTAGEDAAVLVAVAVAQHDVLLGTAAAHQRRVAGQRI